MTEAVEYVMPRYEDNIGLVHLQTKFGQRWAGQNGLNLPYEDIFQEASVAFVIASRGFDPGVGVKFSAYFTKVAFSQFRVMISRETGMKSLSAKDRAKIAARKEENAQLGKLGKPQKAAHKFGLNMMNFSSLEGEEGQEYVETLASDMRTPEAELEFKQNVQEAMDKLSPLAKVVVEWLVNPPDELIEELQRVQAHVPMREAVGLRSGHCEEGVSIYNIKRLLQVISGGQITPGQLTLVEVELAEVAKCL